MKPSNIISEIKSRLSIEEYLSSQGIEVKNLRGRKVCCCPIHQETDASFYINDNGTYHCYGCNEHGDVVNLHQTLNHLPTIADSIRELCEQLGIEGQRNRPSQDPDLLMYERIMTLALEFYTHNLRSSQIEAKECREYLSQRKIHNGIIDYFKIGLGAINQNDMVDFFVTKGINLSDCERFGVLNCHNQKKNYYDPFWKRVIIPIFTPHKSYPIAFGGRSFLDIHKAKYKNSTGNKFYEKGATLFALNFANREIMRCKKVFLMEGYFDVISAHQFGIENSIATLGTAITEQQVRLIKRFTDHISFVFDPDGAGQKAATRGIYLAIKHGLKTSIVLLPHLDPDDFLHKHGADAFNGLADNAPDGLTYVLMNLIEQESAQEVSNWMKSLLNGVEDKLIMAVIQKQISHVLGISVEKLELFLRM